MAVTASTLLVIQKNFKHFLHLTFSRLPSNTHTDGGRKEILVYDACNGSFKTKHSLKDYFKCPLDVAIYRKNTDMIMFVSDKATNLVTAFDESGAFLYHVGGEEATKPFCNLPNQFDFPCSILVKNGTKLSRGNWLFVTDSFNGKIKVFDIDQDCDKFLFEFGNGNDKSKHRKPTSFVPYAIDLKLPTSKSEKLLCFASDDVRCCIDVYDVIANKKLMIIGETILKSARGIAVDPLLPRVYVADTKMNKIAVFNTYDGTFLHFCDDAGSFSLKKPERLHCFLQAEGKTALFVTGTKALSICLFRFVTSLHSCFIQILMIVYQ
jgi:hypothetical protein